MRTDVTFICCQRFSAGRIRLKAETAAPVNATPESLEIQGALDTEILYDDGILRQVIAPEVFADILVVDAYSYEMKFYRIADMGNIVNGFYTPQAGAEPYLTWQVINPDGSSAHNRLHLTENRSGSITSHAYEWRESEGVWALDKGEGTQIIEKKTETVAGDRVITETISNTQGIASRTVTTRRSYAWGEEMIREVADPDGANSATVVTYYDIEGEPGYGQTASRQEPDGSWVWYAYDEENRKIEEIRPWLSSAMPADLPGALAGAAGHHVISRGYTPQSPSDGDAPLNRNLPRKVTETVLGQVVSLTYYAYEPGVNSEDEIEIIERCTAPNAAFGDPGNLRTTTTYTRVTDGTRTSKRVSRKVYPDGRQDSYTYEFGVYASGGSAPGMFTPGAGTDLRVFVVHGTVDLPEGIPGRTTGEYFMEDSFGRERLHETCVYTGAGYERISWEVRAYDDFGRVTDIFTSDGSRSETTRGCCYKVSETDADGVTTDYISYDALGRLLAFVKRGTAAIPDMTTHYTYDAAGRVLTEKISSGGLEINRSTRYDNAGRMVERIDSQGLVTVYSYASGGRVTTITHPGGAKEIRETYSDGRLKSITGTHVINRYYAYGANADGSQWTQIRTGSSGSPMWEKTTTELSGQVISIEKSGFSGVETVRHHYNGEGQLIKTETDGMADTLFEYNELGEMIRTGLDVDGSGSLDGASMDRITLLENEYLNDDGVWWHSRAQLQFTRDNLDEARPVAVTLTRLTGLGGTPELRREIRSIDRMGNLTTTRTHVDRAAATKVVTMDYPDSDIDAETVSVMGLVQSEKDKTGKTVTYAYDALGRRIQRIDPVTGTTVTGYNTRNLVAFTEDAAGNRTAFSYDPATGRKTSQTDALSRTVYYQYNLRGEMTRTWGAALPVRYEFDDLGRMIRMHTYKTKEGWDTPAWPTQNDDLSDITIWHYHPASGQLTSKEDAQGNATTYTYTTAGKLETRTWARTHEGAPLTTTYTYDGATGELIGIDYSDATPDIAFAYNRGGQQAQITDALAQVFDCKS